MMPLSANKTGAQAGMGRPLRGGVLLLRDSVVAAGILVCTWSGAARGQAGVVAGTVYDSTAAAPLAEAQVSVIGVYATGTTDDSGRFRIEDVPPGEYEVSFYHSRLDDYGISVAGKPVVVRLGATSEVHLAVPSLASMLEAWCTEQPGAGDAHVAGVVSDARTGRPLPGAQVQAFVEPAGSAAGQPGSAGGRERSVATVSGTGGEYRLCNVEWGRDVSVRAAFGSNRSAPARVDGPGPRMHDLSVEVSDPVAIMGTVLDHSSQQPIVGAAVSLAGTGQATYTNDEGKFAFVGVTPGSHVIETKQMGYAFRADSLSLLSNAFGLRIPLAAEAIPLAPVVVSTPSRGSGPTRPNLASRFLGITEAEMDVIRDRTTDMASVLRYANIPSLKISEMYSRGGLRIGLCVSSRRRGPRTFDVRSGRPVCEPVAVFLDDAVIGDPSSFLEIMRAQEVASVQFIPGMEARVRYGDRGENGVLLIYTRRR